MLVGGFMDAISKTCLTHWGRVTHICVGNLTTIGSNNGLSPGRRQAINWTNAWILLIGPLWTKFSEILIEIPTFSFKKMRLKVSSAKWRPFCLGLNVLISLLEQITRLQNTIFFLPFASSESWNWAQALVSTVPVARNGFWQCSTLSMSVTLLYSYQWHKNIERHTAHTIVSWPVMI